MRYYAGEREGGGVGVEAPANELEVGRDGAEVGVGCAVGEVAETEGLADFAGGEEFFELWGVKVSEGLVGGGEGEGREGREGGGSAFAGMSIARSGMWRSPITRTRRDVILGVGDAVAGWWWA
jgi:hypothetical protein